MGDTLSFLYVSSGHRTRIGQIRLDATVREEHGLSARVTESPVESGANVADHVIQEADTLNIDGVITETPISFGEQGPQGDDGLVEIPYASTGSRVMDGFEALRRLMERREPITVVTGLRTYTNMVLTNLNVPREPETGLALRFSAELRQVRLVSSASIPPNKAAPKAKSKAQKTANKGKQQSRKTETPKNLPPPNEPPYIPPYTWSTGSTAGTTSTTTTTTYTPPPAFDPKATVVPQDNLSPQPLIVPADRPHIGHGTRATIPEKKYTFRADRTRATRYRGIGGY